MGMHGSEILQRRDLHYHVVSGHGVYMPHDPGHPDSFHRNTIFDNHVDAHKHFCRIIKMIGGDSVGDLDFSESAVIWQDIKEEMDHQYALDILIFKGIDFNEFDIPVSLIACTGCIPYESN